MLLLLHVVVIIGPADVILLLPDLICWVNRVLSKLLEAMRGPSICCTR